MMSSKQPPNAMFPDNNKTDYYLTSARARLNHRLFLHTNLATSLVHYPSFGVNKQLTINSVIKLIDYFCLKCPFHKLIPAVLQFQ